VAIFVDSGVLHGRIGKLKNTGLKPTVIFWWKKYREKI